VLRITNKRNIESLKKILKKNSHKKQKKLKLKIKKTKKLKLKKKKKADGRIYLPS